jgi:hypothetical protein
MAQNERELREHWTNNNISIIFASFPINIIVLDFEQLDYEFLLTIAVDRSDEYWKLSRIREVTLQGGFLCGMWGTLDSRDDA